MHVNDLNPRDPLQFIADYWITPTLTEISKHHLLFFLDFGTEDVCESAVIQN